MPTIKLRLKLSDQQFETLTQICRLRKMFIDGGVDLVKYTSELVDCDIASFRLLRIEQNSLLPQGAPAPAPKYLSSREQKRLRRAEVEGKIIAFDEEGLSIPVIAKRLDCGQMKVGRILGKAERQL